MRARTFLSPLCAGGLAGLLLITAVIGPAPVDAERRDADTGNTGFTIARPGYRYVFPRDHGSHDAFRTEWWYYTGQVQTADGRRFGFELTFFRRGVAATAVRTNPSRWAVKDVYFAHAALSDLSGGRFRYAEQISRAGLGQAGADADRLHVWIGRWHAEAAPDAGAPHRLTAQTADFALDLTLMPSIGPIVHGEDGVSRKGAATAQASHYYSFTRMTTAGTVTVAGKPMAVSGLSWMDHEFGSGELGGDQVGWDWFSLQLENGGDVMIYVLRHADGRADSSSSGTVVVGGRAEALTAHDVRVTPTAWWISPASGARYPAGWRLEIPREDFSADIRPLLADQELRTGRSTRVTYWEGAVSVRATWRGRDVAGQGYVELTGYAKPFHVAP
jgi:predicted secreted hydrolase